MISYINSVQDLRQMVGDASGSEYYTSEPADQDEAVKKIASQLWSEGHDAGLTVRDSWREFLNQFDVNNAIDWLEGKRQSIVPER